MQTYKGRKIIDIQPLATTPNVVKVVYDGGGIGYVHASALQGVPSQEAQELDQWASEQRNIPTELPEKTAPMPGMNEPRQEMGQEPSEEMQIPSERDMLQQIMESYR